MKLRPQVNRAQLLALWQAHGDERLLADAAELFGYQASDKYLRQLQSHKDDQENNIDAQEKESVKKTEQSQQLPAPPPKRPQVTYYYLAQRERYATEAAAQQEIPEVFNGVEAISDDELANFWDDFRHEADPLNVTPLTQPQTMAPFIRQNLRQEVGQRLDVKTLVRQVAKQTPLKTLPTEPRLLPAGRVTVIADLNPRLLPFWDDIREACELIKQKHGKIGLDMRVLAQDEPLADYYAYEDWLRRQLHVKPWQKIPAQSLVIILSDLGQLAPENSRIRQRWLYSVERLNRRGIKPLVLAPVAAERQCPLLQAKTQLMLWQRFGRLKRQKARGDKTRHKQLVERVLSFLSLSPHIEPALLRVFCELLGHHAGQTGIEADVYLHPDVQWGYTAITLKAEQREYYQQQFAQESETVKQAVLRCIGQHHCQQFAVVWAESILNAEKLMDVDPILVSKAEDLMLRFARRYYGESAHDGMMRFARRHLSRLKPEQHTQKSYVPALYGLAYRNEVRSGQAVPPIYNTEIVNQVLREPAEDKQYYLQQRGAQLQVCCEPQKRGQCLAEFRAGQKSILVNKQLVDLPQSTGEIYSLRTTSLHIDTGQEHLSVRSLHKPDWASELSMRDGKLVATLIFAGEAYEMYPEWRDGKAVWMPLNPTHVVGSDEYGLYAELNIKGVTQRFRYITPNTFMMGAPEDEAGRYKYEDLHQVTLTRGYWLADTACTQELWLAVMGENPSDFQNDLQNPVETVSWLDVQAFLRKLNQSIVGLNAHLPSEAQWENACRAGTNTPFNFEGEIDSGKLNYRGTWELEKEGDSYRWGENAIKKTAPVKSYRPNVWGLYEMHGNVWEWCLDEWEENLGPESVTDPLTARFKSGVKPDTAAQTSENIVHYDLGLLANAEDDGVLRVLRGGSWDLIGRLCRSAFRLRYHADYRYRYLGFRLALGHELQYSTVLRSNKTVKVIQSNEQTGQNTARVGAAQGCDRHGHRLAGEIPATAPERGE